MLVFFFLFLSLSLRLKSPISIYPLPLYLHHLSDGVLLIVFALSFAQPLNPTGEDSFFTLLFSSFLVWSPFFGDSNVLDHYMRLPARTQTFSFRRIPFHKFFFFFFRAPCFSVPLGTLRSFIYHSVRLCLSSFQPPELRRLLRFLRSSPPFSFPIRNIVPFVINYNFNY